MKIFRELGEVLEFEGYAGDYCIEFTDGADNECPVIRLGDGDHSILGLQSGPNTMPYIEFGNGNTNVKLDDGLWAASEIFGGNGNHNVIAGEAAYITLGNGNQHVAFTDGGDDDCPIITIGDGNHCIVGTSTGVNTMPVIEFGNAVDGGGTTVLLQGDDVWKGSEIIGGKGNHTLVVGEADIIKLGNGDHKIAFTDGMDGANGDGIQIEVGGGNHCIVGTSTGDAVQSSITFGNGVDGGGTTVLLQGDHSWSATSVTGGNGNNIVSGKEIESVVLGNGDNIVVGQDIVEVKLGHGNNYVDVGETVKVETGRGNDCVFFTDGADEECPVISTRGGNDIIVGERTGTNVMTFIEAGSGDDTVVLLGGDWGYDWGSYIYGGGGNDTLYVSSDTIVNSDDHDTLHSLNASGFENIVFVDASSTVDNVIVLDGRNGTATGEVLDFSKPVDFNCDFEIPCCDFDLVEGPDGCLEFVDLCKGSLSGRYFMDANDNDVDDGEMGIAGVVVTLVETGATTTTAADGSYSFGGLAAGDYSVEFSDPNGVLDGKRLVDANDPNGNGDDTNDSDAVGDVTLSEITGITVTEGADTPNNDAGAEDIPDPVGASISGRYFCDTNDNDIDDGEMEPGVEGARVFLIKRGEGRIADTMTDADGNYSFEGLEAGEYRVRFQDPDDVSSIPDAKGFVEANVGHDTLDSDVTRIMNNGNGQTEFFDLADGEMMEDIDAGVAVEDPAGSAIKGRVFCDSDDDSQDNGEAGVADVTVELLDASGAVIGTTQTDDEGNYEFTGLAAGDYAVRFPTSVDGKELVDANVGDDATDSDADQTTGETGTISLGVNEVSEDNDAGIEDPGTASLAGRVFCDSDDDSQDNGEAGVADVTVELLDASGAVIGTTQTDDEGNYEFTGLDAGDYAVRFPTSVDGKVLVDANVGDDATDSDADQTTGETGPISLGIGERSEDNDAGIEDPAGSAIKGRYFCDENDNDQDDAEPGIVGAVVELLDASGAVIGTTTTDDEGNYEFTGLAAGDYGVRFAADVDGKTFVVPNVGDDSTDSDAVENDDGTATITGITLGINETSEDNDAGAEDPGTASIGDTVWLDTDGNGLLNGSEAGVDGVEVKLIDATTGNVIDTDVTENGGQYLFENLDAGDYQVMFGTTGGLTYTTQSADPADAVNNDSDAGADGMTGTISLDIGEAERDVDAGLVDPGTGSISGRYFCDENNNDVDDDEPGIEGVLVELLDDAGNVVDDTTTGEDGSYSFTGLVAGDYKVRVAADPTGKTFVDANDPDGNGDDTNDSDVAENDDGTATTGTISVGVGEAVEDVDAGVEDTNTAPDPQDDMAKTCADTPTTIDVLDNDVDADGDMLTITAVDGQAIGEGGTVTLASGVEVTLSGGELVVDANGAYESLGVGAEAVESFSYTVSDGSVEASASVDVTFCGAYETLAELEGSLPAGEICFQIIDENDPAGTSGDAFTLLLTGAGGDVRLDGVTFAEAYCVGAYQDILAGAAGTSILDATKLTGTLSLLDDDSVYGGGNPASQTKADVDPNVDADQLDNMINWILNQDFAAQGYSDGEVQGAIWGITDNVVFVANGAGDQADAQEILDLAIANGTDFEACAGDLVAVYVDPTQETENAGHTQPFIVAVNWDECIC